jgi:uncharacterized membrane protein YbhN (UPF0104 family)
MVKGRWWSVLKALLALAIVAGVVQQFWRIFRHQQWQEVLAVSQWELIIVAGLLYVAAQASWGIFWVRLLREQGIQASWYTGLRCYYVSQLGKYVPGKAWVILMRVGMLRQQLQAPATPVAVTATYETLASIGAGALIGVFGLPGLGLLPEEITQRWGWFVAVAALPATLGLLHRLTYRWIRSRIQTQLILAAPSWLLLGQGVVHGVVGWLLLGISLAMLLQGLTGLSLHEWQQYMALLAALSLAYVAGFIVVATPGGLGVREWVLLHTLPSALPETAIPSAVLAAAVALWLRLVWTAAEILTAILLYLRPPSQKHF